MKRSIVLLTVLATALAIAMPAVGADEDGGETQEYIVLMNGNGVSSKQLAALEAAGGTIERVISQVGLVTVSGGADFAASATSINGVRSVSFNRVDNWLPTNETRVAADFANPPNSGDDDSLFDLQWGHDAVNAPEAWDSGRRGAGALVAVLDGGFDIDHPDLAPNIYATMDFTGEGIDYGPNSDDPSGIFCHGCHTAGTVAAADNAIGTIGVAPEANLLLGKVLLNEGSGTFEDVIAGIVWAADMDADIISMSLGARIPKNGDGQSSASEVAELLRAIDRATTYAYQRGSVVIASAGNDGEDYDRNGPAIHSPSDSPHVLSISALGPLGWGVDPTTDLDVPAFYTNFGQSVIDFGAPGGNVDFDLLASGDLCLVAGLVRPCYVFDLVFSTGNGTWYWSAGTSMAAPHASGVAALIVGANGGDMSPSAVERALRRSADDLGKPGNDDYYGWGRVNANG